MSDISNFTSAESKSAFWNVQENTDSFLLCEWTGFQLWAMFRGFLTDSVGANILPQIIQQAANTIVFDAIAAGPGLNSARTMKQLCANLYAMPATDPIMATLDRAIAALTPNAPRATFDAFTMDDRRALTGLMVWITLYSPTPSVAAQMSLWQQILSQQLLPARAQSYRLDQVILPSDCIPFPWPGQVPPPTQGLDTPLLSCRRLSTTTTIAPAPNNTPTQPTTTVARSNTGAIIFGTLGVLLLGTAVGYAVWKETRP